MSSVNTVIDFNSLTTKVLLYFSLEENYYVETKEERDEAIKYKSHKFYKILADSYVEAFREIEELKLKNRPQEEEEEEEYKKAFIKGVKLFHFKNKIINNIAKRSEILWVTYVGLPDSLPNGFSQGYLDAYFKYFKEFSEQSELWKVG